MGGLRKEETENEISEKDKKRRKRYVKSGIRRRSRRRRRNAGEEDDGVEVGKKAKFPVLLSFLYLMICV